MWCTPSLRWSLLTLRWCWYRDSGLEKIKKIRFFWFKSDFFDLNQIFLFKLDSLSTLIFNGATLQFQARQYNVLPAVLKFKGKSLPFLEFDSAQRFQLRRSYSDEINSWTFALFCYFSPRLLHPLDLNPIKICFL